MSKSSTTNNTSRSLQRIGDEAGTGERKVSKGQQSSTLENRTGARGRGQGGEVKRQQTEASWQEAREGDRKKGKAGGILLQRNFTQKKNSLGEIWGEERRICRHAPCTGKTQLLRVRYWAAPRASL